MHNVYDANDKQLINVNAFHYNENNSNYRLPCKINSVGYENNHFKVKQDYICRFLSCWNLVLNVLNQLLHYDIWLLFALYYHVFFKSNSFWLSIRSLFDNVVSCGYSFYQDSEHEM